MMDITQNNNNTNQGAPIVDPVLPFIPKFENKNQQISVGGEFGPTQVESAPRVESGFENREVEKVAENTEKLEVKEPKPPVVSNMSSQVTVKDDKKDEDENSFKPKYIGLRIENELLNQESIERNSGKGDPSLTRTAIYILLERILNKQSK